MQQPQTVIQPCTSTCTGRCKFVRAVCQAPAWRGRPWLAAAGQRLSLNLASTNLPLSVILPTNNIFNYTLHVSERSAHGSLEHQLGEDMSCSQ